MEDQEIDINEVIAALQGTCDSLDSVISQLYPGMGEDDLTRDQREQLDSEIFDCETCGWWYETCEMSEEDRICDDCFDE